MAQDVLGKVVRIDDTKFNPDGAKVEVWTKGRHKYIKWYRDEKNGLISTENYIDGDKISASLSDDEVLTNWLAQYEKTSKIVSTVKAYKIIQDPYGEKPVVTRTYGGKSPYYLNNGCYVTINWIGKIPNVEFTLGTYSTADDAEDAGDEKSPKRWISNTTNLQLGYKIIEDAEITSSADDASNQDTLLPISTWKDSSGNYDRPQVSGKVAKVFFPDNVKEEGEYLACTRGFGSSILAYNTKTVPENQVFEDFVYGGVLQSGSPTNQLKSFRNDDSDSDILKRIIQSFVYQVKELHGTSDYDLKLCSPDSATCSVIEYKSPLKGNDNTLQQTIDQNTVVQNNLPTDTTKIKLNIVGLPDIYKVNDDLTLVVDVKTDIPEFTVYCGDVPKDEVGDEFEQLSEEYTETAFSSEEELEIKFQLSNPSETGESGGDESTGGSNSGGGTNAPPLSGSPGGGTGVRRFQKTVVINGVKVFNGELPDNLLSKMDFCGLKLEKHAAVQMNALNKEFKAKFGKDIAFSGGYRPFSVQNNIFDWSNFDKTGKATKIGTNGGTSAAKPGTSQHGWGLAVDTSGMGDKGSKYFDWLEENGPRFGWVNPSWAKGSGPGHEPWHREYIGSDRFK